MSVVVVYPHSVTRPTDWVPAYQTKNERQWCHVDRLCLMTAQLKGYGMKPAPRRIWYNHLDRCVTCGEIINWME